MSATNRFFTEPLASRDPELWGSIVSELGRQREEIELIASENIVSRAVMEAQGAVMTNKYAEGYPGKRYYGGCQWVDVAENLAIDRACKLFGCSFANVQPNSGSQANQGVFMALIQPGDTMVVQYQRGTERKNATIVAGDDPDAKRVALELARRGGGLVSRGVALAPGGFRSPNQKYLFYWLMLLSRRIVRILDPVLPALTRSVAARCVLFAVDVGTYAAPRVERCVVKNLLKVLVKRVAPPPATIRPTAKARPKITMAARIPPPMSRARMSSRI